MRSTVKCPECGEQGYLIREKVREKQPYRSRVPNRKTKYVSTKRVRRPVFRILHNVKKDGVWKPVRCYLGVYQKPEKDEDLHRILRNASNGRTKMPNKDLKLTQLVANMMFKQKITN